MADASLNYTKNEWNAGQPITSDKMNHIEDGIKYSVDGVNQFYLRDAELNTAVNRAENAINQVGELSTALSTVSNKTDKVHTWIYEVLSELDNYTYTSLLAVAQRYQTRITTLETASSNHATNISMLDAARVQDETTLEDHTTAINNLQSGVAGNTNYIEDITSELGMVRNPSTGRYDGGNSRVDELETRIGLLDGQDNGVIKSLSDQINNINSSISHSTHGLQATYDLAYNAKTNSEALITELGSGFDAQNTVSAAVDDIKSQLTDKVSTDALNNALSNKADTSALNSLAGIVSNNSTTIVVPKDKVTFNNNVPQTFINISIEEKNDYLIQSPEDDKYYYWKPIQISTNPVSYEWHLISGATSGSGVGNNAQIYDSMETFNLATPEENKDYYVQDEGNYIHHFRYVATEDELEPFRLIEIGQIINTNNIKRYNLTSSTEGENTEQKNYIDLYEFDYGVSNNEFSDGTRIAHIELVGGGSGGTTTARKFTRITSKTVNIAKGSSDPLELRYFYTTGIANESDHYVLTQSSRSMAEKVILEGSIDSGDPSKASTTWPTGEAPTGFGYIDVSEYCKNAEAEIQKFTLKAYDEDTPEDYTIITWEINIVNLTITSNYPQNNIFALNQNVQFTYIPSGNVSKTVHFLINGTEIGTTNLSKNITSEQTYNISMPQDGEGIYKLSAYLTATLDNKTLTSTPIYRDIIWRAADSTTLYISSPYRNSSLNISQYEEINIPYTISGNQQSYTVEYYINDAETPINTIILSNGAQGNWSYKPLTAGTDILKIKVNEKYITITLNISEITTDITPVTANLALDFNPQGLSNNSNFARAWTDGTTHLTVSDNFDWYNGGYGSDETGDYFLIKSGTRAYLDYKMFTADQEEIETQGSSTIYTQTSNVYKTGKEMKVIFKTSAVRSIDAVWFTNTGRYDAGIDKEVGIQLSVHQGWLKTDTASDVAVGTGDEQVAATNTYLYFPYSEEDKIELDININKEVNQAGNYIMSYEDGVPSKAYAYTHAQKLYHDPNNLDEDGETIKGESIITLGSDDCDVYIYRLRVYDSNLTSAQILRNFIADGKDVTECLDRYNRNAIYYNAEADDKYSPYEENGYVLDPEALAVKVPNVKVLMLDAPSFTLNKKTFIKNSTLRCIHAPGGTIYPSRGAADNWYFENGYHAGQGTTSDKYGDAGRNIDFLFNCDGQNKPSDKVAADSEYISQVTTNYGTSEPVTSVVDNWMGTSGKVSLTSTSVPNNFFNFKVNIASSENVNNALLQKRYNDFLPYISPAKRRNANIKNDMEFVPAVMFLRENGNGTHSEFNDTNWHFYALGNLGDSKKTDYTRAYDPTDPYEFTLEISDNNTNNSQFQTGVYLNNGNPELEKFKIEQDMEDDGTTPIPNSYTAIGISGAIDSMNYVYPLDTPELKAMWNEVDDQGNYTNKAHWALVNEPYDGDHSFEMRYAYCGNYRDGKHVNGDKEIGNAIRNKNSKVWQAFYSWVVTATNEEFVRDLDQWCVRSAMEFWYAFTHYYTMMDNRAKNTFWHFAKTGTHREVTNPINDMIHVYDELIDNEYVRTEDTTVDPEKTYYTEYAFDMWDYDNDTALGIDNNGELVFPYGKEDGDYKIDNDPSSGMVYNGAGSVFWRRLRDLCGSEISNIFTSVSEQFFNAQNLINQFDKFQECYPEALWQVDINRKYVRPFTGESLDNSIPRTNQRFLKNMMQGRKKYQRRQWIKDQYYYFGSKYKLGNIMNDDIFLDCYKGPNANWNITIVPYQNMYLNVNFGETPRPPIRAKAGQKYEFQNPFPDMNNSRIYIYGASRLQALGGAAIYDNDEIIGMNGLASVYAGNNDFSKAEKLRYLYFGTDDTTYANANLKEIKLGNNPILEVLDLKNCSGLDGALDLSNKNNLQVLEAEGTTYSLITLPSSSQITTLHLPSTITSLTLLSARLLSDFAIMNKETGETDYSNLRTLLIDDSDYSNNIQWLSIAGNIINNLRELYLLNLNTASINDIDELAKFKEKRDGLSDESLIQLSGTVHVNGDWSEVEKTTYESEWDNKLVLDTTNGHENTKYAVTYRYDAYDDGQGHIIKSKDIMTIYVKAHNPAPDIYDTGLISMPTRQKTVRYEFNFGTISIKTGKYVPYSGWKRENSTEPLADAPIIDQNITIETYFNTSTRYYPIRWFVRDDNQNVLVKTSTPVQYGEGASQTAPTVEEIHTAGANTCSVTINGGQVEYSIFDGWDKLPININPSINDESFDIYSVWKTGETTITEMFDDNNISNLTPEQLLVLSAMDNSTRNLYGINSKIGINTRITYNMGYDSKEEGTVLINSPLLLEGGTNQGQTTAIQPLKAGNDAFTIAIDYSFNPEASYTRYGILASCYYCNMNAGVRNGMFLYYDNNTGPRVGFGDFSTSSSQSKPVGNINNAYLRNMVVLRHPAGSQYLYVYSGLSEEDNLPVEIKIQTLEQLNYTSDAYLTFGRLLRSNEDRDPLDDLPNNISNGQGTIYWSKYWNKDLGEGECRQLASWPHEPMSYAISYMSNNRTSTNRVSGNVTPSIKLATMTSTSHAKYYQGIQRPTTTSTWTTYTWANSPLYNICNKRVFNGLPVNLQAILCKSITSSTVSTSTDSGQGASYGMRETNNLTYDYVQLYSAANVLPDGSIYETEDTVNSPFIWFDGAANVLSYNYTIAKGWTPNTSDTNKVNYLNLRFPYIPLVWSNHLRVFKESDTISNSTSIAETIRGVDGSIRYGDVCVLKNNGGTFMYVPDTEVQSLGIEIEPDGTNDRRFTSDATLRGGWVRADAYWTRSMIVGNNGVNFAYVQITGDVNTLYNNNASTAGLKINYLLAL